MKAQSNNLTINNTSPLFVYNENNKCMNVNMPNSDILNLTGVGSVLDLKYKISHSIIENNKALRVIVSNQDHLSYDFFTDLLINFSESNGQIVLFYDTTIIDSIAPKGHAKRILNAYFKLKCLGINVHFCQGISELKKCLHNLGFKNTQLSLEHKVETNKTKKYFKTKDLSFIEPKFLRQYKPQLTLIKSSDVA